MTAPTHESVLASIVETRGGKAAFSVEQLAIASALARMLCALGDGDTAGTANVATFIGLLPPVKTGGHIDPKRLNDRELDQFERLIRKATVPGPPPLPNTPAAQIEDLLQINDKAQGVIDDVQARLKHAEVRLRKFEKQDGTWQARCLAAEAAVVRLQREAEASAVAPAAPAPAPATRDNVCVDQVAIRSLGQHRRRHLRRRQHWPVI
jgi:hypothetical protein